MAKTVPSISDALRAAGVPLHISREQIAAMGPVNWLSATPAEATNPQTGIKGEGLLVTIEDDGGTHYTSFIANVVLSRILGSVDFPFRARLVKKDRTWTFAD